MKTKKSPSMAEKFHYLYDYPSHFKITFQQDSTKPNLTNLFAQWPEYVRSNKETYNEHPRFVIKEEDNLIAILFEKRPLMHFYDLEKNNKIGKKIINFPGYTKGRPINPQRPRVNPIKSSLIRSFKKDFNGHAFYAFYEHPINNRKSGHRIKGMADKKREVIVFDEGFNVKKLLKFKDYKSYYGHLTRAKDGFFLIKRDHDEKITLVYVRI